MGEKCKGCETHVKPIECGKEIVRREMENAAEFIRAAGKISFRFSEMSAATIKNRTEPPHRPLAALHR